MSQTVKRIVSPCHCRRPIQAVDTQAELPEVDNDLRVFSEISMGLAGLARQAARPIETRNTDDDEEAEDE